MSGWLSGVDLLMTLVLCITGFVLVRRASNLLRAKVDPDAAADPADPARPGLLRSLWRADPQATLAGLLGVTLVALGFLLALVSLSLGAFVPGT